MPERKLYKSGLLRRLEKFFRRAKPFERRRDARFIASCTIECLCLYKESGRQLECLSYIKDISKTGLLITTAECKIYPQTEVELRIKLPNNQETISILGRVIRTYRRETGIWYYSGLEFQDRSEKNVRLLLDFASGKS